MENGYRPTQAGNDTVTPKVSSAEVPKIKASNEADALEKIAKELSKINKNLESIYRKLK